MARKPPTYFRQANEAKMMEPRQKKGKEAKITNVTQNR